MTHEKITQENISGQETMDKQKEILEQTNAQPRPLWDERRKEEQVRAAYRRLTLFLIAKKLTITTMESATGGQIASLITDTEGSSAVLKGAFVTYCNEAKIMQGVPEEIIGTYTVYSEETARAMAAACRKTYGADIGIGVTGTMGNTDPANPEASTPGEVFFALSLSEHAAGVFSEVPETEKGDLSAVRTEQRKINEAREAVQSFHLSLPPMPSRLAYKMAVAAAVAEKLGFPLS